MSAATGLVRRGDVLRAQLHALIIVAQSATPAPWDSRRGSVMATTAEPHDPRDVEYYGPGRLVCESIGSSGDAHMIALARNVVPDLAAQHLDALDRVDRLERDNRYLRLVKATELFAPIQNGDSRYGIDPIIDYLVRRTAELAG